MTCAERARFVKEAFGVESVTSVEAESLYTIFGHRISHDALTIPHPSPPELCRMIHAPPLVRTGWYDWCLNDALETFETFRREAKPEVAARARLLVTPYAHNMPGYHEGMDTHPELWRGQSNLLDFAGLMMHWYD